MTTRNSSAVRRLYFLWYKSDLDMCTAISVDTVVDYCIGIFSSNDNNYNHDIVLATKN